MHTVKIIYKLDNLWFVICQTRIVTAFMGDSQGIGLGNPNISTQLTKRNAKLECKLE